MGGWVGLRNGWMGGWIGGFAKVDNGFGYILS
jgi:hypothetical protein